MVRGSYSLLGIVFLIGISRDVERLCASEVTSVRFINGSSLLLERYTVQHTMVLGKFKQLLFGLIENEK